MHQIFIGLLDGEEGNYGGTIPDLPGCTAMGAYIFAALRSAKDSASEWIYDAITDGQGRPKSRSFSKLKDTEVREALACGSVLVLVCVLLRSGP